MNHYLKFILITFETIFLRNPVGKLRQLLKTLTELLSPMERSNRCATETEVSTSPQVYQM